MKVIQVTPRYYPHIGGIETHVREICRRLVKHNIDVTVVTTDPANSLSREEYIDGIKVKRFRGFAPSDSFYFCPGIYFFIKGKKCDIIHIHGYHVLSTLFAVISNRRDPSFIFTPHYHGAGHTIFRNILNKLYKPVGAWIFDKADRVICVSKYEMDLVKRDFNIPDFKLVMIPNGVNLEEFKGIEPTQKDHKTLLYVGRLEEYKGIQYIIKALPQLSDYRFEIIGKGVYKNELRRLAEKVGVSTRIDWLEGVSREVLLQHYASADVFLMLSAHEAYGITVAEALASGTPCVVAIGSALEEFVDGERCIGIEAPITTDKLIEAIKQLKNAEWDTKDLPISDWDDVTDRLMSVYGGVQ